EARQYVRLEEPRSTRRVDDEVDPGDVTQPKRLVRPEGRCGGACRDLLAQARRRVEASLTRVVPRLEAVDARQRLDFDRGQGRGPIPRVDDANGDFGAGDHLLDECDIAVGVRVDHGARKLTAVVHEGDALRGAAAGGLHDKRRGQLFRN